MQKKYFIKEVNSRFFQGPAIILCLFLLLFSFMATAQDRLWGLTPQGGSSGGGTIFNLKADGSDFQNKKNFVLENWAPYTGLTWGSDGNLYGRNNIEIFKIAPDGTGYAILRTLSATDGYGGEGKLMQAADGYLYGMSNAGGQFGYGSLFKIATNGTGFTVLRHFNIASDGGKPLSSVMQGNDGYLYGMCHDGGQYGYGTIFKVSTAGANFTVLRHLDNTNDGGNPWNSLIQGTDGYLYGGVRNGGRNGKGTIIRLMPDGSSFAVIHAFRFDGMYPYETLLQGTDGFLYGTTMAGGQYTKGLIFKLATNGSAFSVLRAFNGTTDGSNPSGSLVQVNGELYGTNSLDGGPNGHGVFYKIGTNGTGFTVLRYYNEVLDGDFISSITLGTDGNFYGSCHNDGQYGYGTIYKMAVNGTNFTILRHFNISPEGAQPAGGLTQGTDGNYYGMVQVGGSGGGGGVFKTAPDGTGFVMLYSFPYTTGSYALDKVIQASDGNLYGMTDIGGLNKGGTIFKVATNGTGFSILRHFTPNSTTDGSSPRGSLIQGSDGNLYGMTASGGQNNAGIIFKIAPGGSGFTILRHLNSKTDGSAPKGSLIRASDGNLYGMTYQGGSSGYGTIFRIAPGSTGFTVLWHFTGGTDGRYPSGGLIQGADGNLYGMTSRTVFKVALNGTGFAALHQFSSATDGSAPFGNLVQGSGGFLYGLTSSGGLNNKGTIFKVQPNGTGFAVIRHLNASTDGAAPKGSLFIESLGTPVNSAPVLAAIGNKTVTIGGTLSFAVSGSDTDIPANMLTYSMASAPAGATLDLVTGAFSYTPAPSSVGTYTVTFRVADDGGLYDEEAITITVNSTGQQSPPQISSFTPAKGPVGTLVTITGTNFFSVSAVDFNGVIASSFQVINSTTITATVPSGASTSKISVTTSSGKVASKQRFQVTASERLAQYSETGLVPLICYPNPTSGEATIIYQLEKGGSYTLDLLDVKGSKVSVLAEGDAEAYQQFNYQLDGSKLQNGQYLIRFISAEGVRTFKLQISR